MIVIPTGTDAPIYHWPYATVGMILLNVALFFVVPPPSMIEIIADDEVTIERLETRFDSYALTLGDGIRPVQWVTHNFLHLDIFHILGNCLFLWAFGIVVEGKLGAGKYLAVYLGIGTLHGAFVQILLLGSGLHTSLAGASAVVFGLLACCMIWAPRNEVTCLIILPFGFRILSFYREFYYTTVALFYLGEQVVGLAFGGGVAGVLMITELAHLSGALWGSVLAVGLLKLGLVDCEGWDLFSRWANWTKLGRDWKARGDRQEREEARTRETLKAQMKAKKKAAAQPGDEPDAEERSAAASRKVTGRIEKGDLDGALRIYDKSSRELPYWPKQPDLFAMIKALQDRGAVAESVKLMKDHCRRFPAQSDRMALKLAQVLIRDRQRPIAGLGVLEAIPEGALPPDLEKVRQALTRQAEQMKEDGVLELDAED